MPRYLDANGQTVDAAVATFPNGQCKPGFTDAGTDATQDSVNAAYQRSVAALNDWRNAPGGGAERPTAAPAPTGDAKALADAAWAKANSDLNAWRNEPAQTGDAAIRPLWL